ncbi:MAG: amidohydrolase [Magnetovibrio sp.]|nr:amidohydrolase [Magnetovibrio sp.]
MQIIKRSLAVLGWFVVFPAFADGAIGDGVKTLPLFDAHMHYKEPAWDEYPVGTVIELMDKSGVAMALVSSTPDDGTIMLWEHAPDRIVPEMRPYKNQAGSGNWTKFPGMLDYITQRLDAYPHTGIGEFHLHRIDPADKDLINGIVSMAIKRDIFVHVHSGQEPVKLLLALEPNLKVIWAHAGMSEPPEVIEPLMEKHATLYADTSFRESDILAVDGIDPEWEALLIKFSDRFMVGSDTWVNDQWARYETLMAINRKWLSYLPREVAERIAYKNAQRLFERNIKLD